MQKIDLDELFTKIEKRYGELQANSERQRRFLDHVQALGSWENDDMDYPEVSEEFPDSLVVAYAVCHSDRGTKEFIVDGSTQECQRCGRLMYRTAVKNYKKA